MTKRRTTQRTRKARKPTRLILAIVSGFTLRYPLYLAVLADPGAVSVGGVNQVSDRLLRRRRQRNNLQRGGGVSDRAVQGMLAPVSGAPSRAALARRNLISVGLDGRNASKAPVLVSSSGVGVGDHVRDRRHVGEVDVPCRISRVIRSLGRALSQPRRSYRVRRRGSSGRARCPAARMKGHWREQPSRG